MKRIILILTVLVTAACQNKKSSDQCNEYIPADERPSVMVIGDSISLGYTPLLNVPGAQVFHAPCNSEDSANGVAKIDGWLANRARFDTITINHGIWDIRSGVAVTTYVANLRVIVTKALARADHVYFVNTTQPTHAAWPQAKVDEFNAAAATLMDELGVQVIDANTLSHSIKSELSDELHYNATGSQALADLISPVIN